MSLTAQSWSDVASITRLAEVTVLTEFDEELTGNFDGEVGIDGVDEREAFVSVVHGFRTGGGGGGEDCHDEAVEELHLEMTDWD